MSLALSDKIQASFNSYNGTNPEVLESLYAGNIEFRDPVVNVQGLENLKKYYQNIYKNVVSITFHFEKFHWVDSLTCSAQWEMELVSNKLNDKKPYRVQGCSFFTFNEEGKLSFHRDYVDMGQMVYEKIPILGFFIRKLKTALKAESL